MDAAGYCVYNVTRSALLSERVISVSEHQASSQLLSLVMNGPGRDPLSCIRLTAVSLAPQIPRLFAFDVAYLDDEQRVVDLADVGPATPFPPISSEVATILFLSDQVLAHSNTERGDFIRVCTEAELATLLRATAQLETLGGPEWPIESPHPAIPPDPFAGSLIFLPSSGTPQTSEFFMPSPAFPPSALHAITASASETQEFDLTSPPEEAEEPTEYPLDEEPTLSPSDTDVSELPQIADEQTPPLIALSEDPPPTSAEDQHVPTSRPELPFHLKALMQSVDDRLRREREQQAVSEELPALQLPPIPHPAAPPVEITELTESTESAETLQSPNQSFQATYSEIVEVTEPAGNTELAETPQIVDEPLELINSQIAEITSPAPPEVPKSSTSEPPLRTQKRAAAPPQEQPRSFQTPPPEPKRPISISSNEKLPFATRVQRWLAGDSVSLNGNRRRGERVLRDEAPLRGGRARFVEWLRLHPDP